ncbi:hypothetical protein AGMMS49928_16270 [Spirochaetia bacterium]|nr:hypothetical protein AGMMS49928_16270 [Spirochaetia bacterium]
MKYGKWYFGLVLPLMLAALTACTNPVTQGAAPDTAPPVALPAGMGALTVSLQAEGQTRTAIPTFNFAKYVISFSGGPALSPVTIDPAAAHTVYLLPGNWTVGVSAYTDAACTVLAAEGSAPVTVTAGTAASVTVQLGFPASAAGTLTYTMIFPADTYSVQELRVTKVDDPSPPPDYTNTTFTSGTPYSLPTLNAGAYILAVKLVNTTQGRTAWWETAVHIYGGHTTNVSHTFVAADFEAYIPAIGNITLTQNAVPTSLEVKAYPDAASTSPIGSVTVATLTVLSGASQTYEYTLFIPASLSSSLLSKPYLRLVANGVNTSTPEEISSFPVTEGPLITDFSRTFSGIDTGAPGVSGNGTVSAKIGGASGATVDSAFEGEAITLVAAPGTDNVLIGDMSISGAALDGGSGLTRTFTMPQADVTVTAAFLPQYTVTFNKQGHGTTTPGAQTITQGGLVTSPGNLTQTGYTFGGWYKDNTCTDPWNFAADTVAGNTTIWAKWTADNYGITYELNGGTNHTGNPATYTIESNITLAAPTKTNYDFAGWYTDGGFTTAAAVPAIAAGSTGDKDFYARWKTKGDISIQPPGASGRSIIITADGPTTTINWANGTVTFGINDTTALSDISWQVNGQTVTGGTLTVTPNSTGNSYGLVTGKYTITVNFILDEIKYSEEIILTVTVILPHTVTFNNLDHGTTPAQTFVYPGGLVTNPGDLSETGWTFDGWYKESDCTTPWNFIGDTVTGNITLYAKWTINTYTVDFNTQGSDSISSQTVNHGSTVSYPVPPVRDDWDVAGWYTDSDCTTPWNFAAPVTGSRTLYAKWVSEDVSDFGVTPLPGNIHDVNSPATWAAAITAINTNPGNHIINLTAGFSLPQSGSADNPEITSNSTVSIRGNQTIALSANGSILNITSGKTVILRGPTLQGVTSATVALVRVSGGVLTLCEGVITGQKKDAAANYGGGVYVNSGTFFMRGGTISGNTSTVSTYGGAGVAVDDSGNFTMSGGTISGNEAGAGGGVFVRTSGGFTMSGGTISGNTATSSSDGGGGVWVRTGSFAMSGGTISNNKATNDSGGGVHVYIDGTFTMSGGTISGNEAASGGGGVYVTSSGSFTMNGGTISGNKATGTDGGGGVYFNSSGNFTMSGGTISNNESGYSSGGVRVQSGNFTMSGGNISDNKAGNSGGGVIFNSSGNFTMSGGTISGNEAPVSAGGVGVTSSGSFTMSGGTISGNKANGSNGGGGVQVNGGGSFTMSDGTISGNKAATNGGGVYFGSSGATFTMNGGTISGNDANNNGGGVYVYSGSFAMSDGTISNNEAASGGGVFVYSSGNFTMSGGTISGNDASNGGGVTVSGGTFAMSGGTISNNKALSTVGGGVYVLGVTFTKTGSSSIAGNSAVGAGKQVFVSGSSKVRNSDAGPGVNLDASYAGSIPGGGWE